MNQLTIIYTIYRQSINFWLLDSAGAFAIIFTNIRKSEPSKEGDHALAALTPFAMPNLQWVPDRLFQS